VLAVLAAVVLDQIAVLERQERQIQAVVVAQVQTHLQAHQVVQAS
jgi:hypothetical protein